MVRADLYLRQSSNELDSSLRREMSSSVILSEAKDDTVKLFKLSKTILLSTLEAAERAPAGS